MGTEWQVQCYLNPPTTNITETQLQTHLQAGLQSRLDQVVAQMSPWETQSDLSRFNRTPLGQWTTLPEEFAYVLQHALFVAEQTQGAYDPSVAALSELWGFGVSGKTSQQPSAQAIEQALANTGWQHLEWDRQDRRLRRMQAVQIDLCAIAKGYAVDQLARYLRQLGVPSYLVEVGGELRGFGTHPNKQPWWVELEVPSNDPDVSDTPNSRDIEPLPPSALARVALHELAVATSGDYRRFFVCDGQRFAHTIDPRHGYPVQHRIASVTVLHPECMMADALATAIAVLGPEQGLHYAKQLQVAARILLRPTPSDPQWQTLLSPALAAMME